MKSLATAFVLLNAETGLESEVLKSIRELEEVKEAHMLNGAYDIIALIETPAMVELKNVISRKIRRLEKVQGTITMIVQ